MAHRTGAERRRRAEMRAAPTPVTTAVMVPQLTGTGYQVTVLFLVCGFQLGVRFDL